MKNSTLLLFLSLALLRISNTTPFGPSHAEAASTFETRVLLSECDAEERSSGSVKLSSSDLELTTDGSRDQVVGICFQNVVVPQGSQISQAYIQFTVDETKNTDGTLSVYGQASDSAAEFSSSSFDVSGRPKTTARVDWNPLQWTTVGASGANQRTPDLASIVQEIVNRSGWQGNNHMAFVIEGSGIRVAEAYDGSQSSAPLLRIEYDTGPGDPDNQAPSVPQNLSATAVSSSQIDLTWDASTDDVAVADYNIFRGGSLLTTVAGTSHSDTSLISGATYSYAVSALDAAGNESGQSTSVSATTDSGGTDTLTITPTDDATITDGAPDTNMATKPIFGSTPVDPRGCRTSS
jgi:titin